jgi:hypothetical protein
LLATGPGQPGAQLEGQVNASSRVVWFVAILLAALVVQAGAQQASSLATSEAKAFIGDWMLTMETPQGSNQQSLAIKDMGGKVAANLGGGRGGPIDISDIKKSGEDLVLTFERNIQGNTIPIVLTLTLKGDTLTATQDIAGGQFVMNGTGKKKM